MLFLRYSILTCVVGSVYADQHVFDNDKKTDLAEIDHYVTQLGERYHFPGVSLGVVQQDDSIKGGWKEYQGNYGMASVSGDPVTTKTRFGIASNSKLFTTLAVGMLVENHTILPNGEELTWRSKVKDILPGWGLMDEYAGNHVDLIDLLGHRTGMPRHDNAHGVEDDPATVAADMRHLRPSYEIRQHLQYNNQAYVTASHIVAVLSGLTFNQYVERHFFHPLGMRQTTYNAIDARKTGHLADGFARVNRNATRCQEAWHGVEDIDPSCLGEIKGFGWWASENSTTLANAGPGGVIITSHDAIKWLKELVDPQIIPLSILQKASKAIEVMTQSPTDPHDGIISYGLGQMQWSINGVNVIGHTGSVPGQMSIMIRIPDYKAALMVMTNDGDLGAPIMKLIAYRLVEMISGIKDDTLEEREMQRRLAKLPVMKDIPGNPNPAPKESKVLGTYDAPVYGNLSLHSLDTIRDQYSKTPINDKALDAVKTSLQAIPLNVTGPMYLARIDKTFASHLLFTHYSGQTFNWTAIDVLPVLDKNRRVSGEWISLLMDLGSAVIDGNGIGMFGNWWGGEGEDAIRHAEDGMDDVEKKAEVWFTKVHA